MDTSYETVYTEAETPRDSPFGTVIGHAGSPDQATSASAEARGVAVVVGVPVSDDDVTMKTPSPKQKPRRETVGSLRERTPESNENTSASAARTQTSQKRRQEAEQAISPASNTSPAEPAQKLEFADTANRIEPGSSEEQEADPAQEDQQEQ